MKSFKWQWPIMLTAMVLGLMLTFQFRATQEIQKESNNSTRRFATFLTVLKKAETRRVGLEKEVIRLREQIRAYREGAEKSPAVTGVTKEIDRLKVITGELPVEGSGLVLTLDDRNIQGGTVIYSSDLKDVINILRYGGAEAISINGQRIVTNTAVHEAGRNLLVNKVPITRTSGVPYEIAAIGNAAELENYLRVTYGLLPDLEAGGVRVNIVRQERLVIPAFKGGTTFRLAKPAGVEAGR
ncbi:MAG: DUF881 domain-containing protein [Clostridia bacterium]|nr:DUF881 domain-containing protein [Clostridia bacterium]